MTTSEEWAEKFSGYVPRASGVNGATQAGVRALEGGGDPRPQNPDDTPQPIQPPQELPQPGEAPEGDPGPEPGHPTDVEKAAAQGNQTDADLMWLGFMARKAVRYEHAFLALLAGYTVLHRCTAQALSYLDPADLDGKDNLKNALAEELLAAERALHAQQPPSNMAPE